MSTESEDDDGFVGDVNGFFIEHFIYMAKEHGCQHSARQLLSFLRDSVAQNEPLHDAIRPYLLEALDNILSHGESADLALRLRPRRGVGKTPTHYRNIRIAHKVAAAIKSGMTPTAAYDAVSAQKHEGDDGASVSLSEKRIKEIYLKYKDPIRPKK